MLGYFLLPNDRFILEKSVSSAVLLQCSCSRAVYNSFLMRLSSHDGVTSTACAFLLRPGPGLEAATLA